MSDSELLSTFRFWTHLAEFGCVMVIIGIVGEGFELVVKWWKKRWFSVGFGNRLGNLSRVGVDWLIRRCRNRILEIETISLALVAAGLLIEIVSSHVAYGISDSQNDTLNKEAADARRESKRLQLQIMETSNNVVKNDPRNANISDMSATSILIVKGEVFNDLTNDDSGRVAKMTLWKNEKLGTTLDALLANNFTRNDDPRPLFGYMGFREYGIRLHSFNFNAANGFEYPVKMIDEVHIVHIVLNFLPRDSEIAGGRVELVVNNDHKMFTIPRQNDTNSDLGWEPGFPCCVIATNGVQSSEKQFLYLRN